MRPPIETICSRMEQLKFFKDCLPQILLDPFLNTLFQLKLALTRNPAQCYFPSLVFALHKKRWYSNIDVIKYIRIQGTEIQRTELNHAKGIDTVSSLHRKKSKSNI